MKIIRNTFDYDPLSVDNEVNNEPSMTSCDFYESLGDKLARYTSCGFPRVSDLDYSEELEIDEEPGFDLSDIDLVTTHEVLEKANKKRSKRNESSEVVSDNSAVVVSDKLQSFGEDTSNVSQN